jgi:hypothetical protein
MPQMLFAGFLPFSAIYIELHYIFVSVWGHKDFTIFSILFVVFCILLIVTATITVVLTYFQLAVEDHRWWWRSMLCGGATGVLATPAVHHGGPAVLKISQCHSATQEHLARVLGVDATFREASEDTKATIFIVLDVHRVPVASSTQSQVHHSEVGIACRVVRVRILLLLPHCTVRIYFLHASQSVLWVHGNGVLCAVPHPGISGLCLLNGVRPLDIQKHQE